MQLSYSGTSRPRSGEDTSFSTALVPADAGTQPLPNESPCHLASLDRAGSSPAHRGNERRWQCRRTLYRDRALTALRYHPYKRPANGWSAFLSRHIPSISPSTCPISSTASARRWWRASRRDGLAGAHLSIASWRVLAALSSNGGLRQTDLAELTSIDASTLSRLITRLVRDGLVRRTRSKQDSREVTVALTRQGRERDAKAHSDRGRAADGRRPATCRSGTWPRSSACCARCTTT